MIWFLGFAILVLNFAFEWYRYFFAGLGDPSRGFSSRPRWEAAALSWLSPSTDRTVEGHRRSSVICLILAVAWLIVGLPIGAVLEAVASETEAGLPWLETVVVAVSLLVLVLIARLAARIAQSRAPIGDSVARDISQH